MVDRKEKTILDFNEKGLELSGWPAAALRGQPASMLFRKKFLKPGVYESATLHQSEGRTKEVKLLVHEYSEAGFSFYALCMLEHDERFRHLMNGARDGIIILSRKLKVLEVNPAFSQITGLAPDAVMGKSVRKIVQEQLPAPQQEPFLDGFNKIIEGSPSAPLEFKFNQRALSLSTALREEQSTVIAILRDVTEEKKALDALKDSEEKYRFLSDATIEGIVVHKHGIILDANESTLSMMDISYEDCIGKRLDDFVPDEEDRKTIRSSIEEENPSFHDIRIRRPDGSEFICEIQARTVINKGAMVRIIAIRDITKTFNLQKRLAESEQKYRAVFENTGAATCILAKDGTVVLANSGFAGLSGYSIDELEGKIKWMVFVHEDDLEKMLEYHKQRRIDDDELPNEYDFRFVTKSGLIRHVHLLVDMIPGTELSIASSIDMSARLKAEQELRLREQELTHAQVMGKMGSWTIDLNTGLASGSETTKAIYGLKDMEAATLEKIMEAPLPEYRKMMEAALQKLISGEAPYDLEFRLKNLQNGRFLDVRSVAEYDPGMRVVKGIIQDITERKQAETLIRQSEQYLTSVFRAAPVGIGVVVDRLFTQVNDRVVQMTGYTREELLGQESRMLYPNDHEHTFVGKEKYRQIAETGSGTVETVWKCKDGSLIEVLLSSTPIDPKDLKAGVTFSALDITLRKNAERDLLAKNRELTLARDKAEESDRLKTAFLSNMSHEIRTPMNGIIGFTSLLADPKLSDEELSSYIEIIRESGDRLMNTVNDLIDISKIETGQIQLAMENTRIDHLLQSLFRFFEPEAAKKGLTLSYEPEEKARSITLRTDEHKLNSILTNLIKNALKFTDRGSVRFGFMIEGEPGSQQVRFFVKDTGTGIPSHRQEAIFNRFEQADIEDRRAREGSGLGLAIALSYADMLGGRLKLKSEEGRGTDFFFTLPLLQQNETAEVETTSGQSEVEMNRSEKIKVLIAEDDEASFRHMSILIRDQAREILRASTGLEAVEMCREHSDIDLILMDVKMPDVNGLEATEMIRSFNQKIYIIAQTAYALAGDEEAALRAGCNDYLTKPIHRQRLSEKLNRAMALMNPTPQQEDNSLPGK